MTDHMTTSSHSSSQVQQGFVDNWQGGKSLAECNLHMLNSEDTCDVIFRVGSVGQVINAHRYLMISRSCVFYSMFTGPLAETSEVRIPDIEVEDFKTFLLYLYTNETTVDSDNVVAMLYIAKKYAVTGLDNQCRKFLANNITAENACTVLEAAHCFDERKLYEKAFNWILEEGSQVLKSLDFLERSRHLLDKISEADELNADEEELFEAVNKWAESECKRKCVEISPDTKRSVLGDVARNIRYNSMKLNFVSTIVKDSGLLPEGERTRILDNIIGRVTCSQDCTHRRKRASVTRLRSSRMLWKYNAGRVDAISFKSNKNIQLLGLKLYGAIDRTNSCKVASYFGTEELVMSSEIQTTTEYPAGDNETYGILFPRAADVLQNVWYTVAVVITGPNTLRGVDGAVCMKCEDGVEFKFRESKHSQNGTSTLKGQIPSLIYRRIDP